MPSVDPFLARTHIAYFSMEIAVRPEMRSYAGGLGILAGDTARSCADLELPVVFLTLLSRAGYFRQEIDADGRQIEQPDWWEPEHWCTPLNAMVGVEIEKKPIWIRPWLYVHTCPHGHQIPILLLDTDLEQNGGNDRALTHYLYGGDDTYRLKQEIILGIGGIRILRALGFDLHTYHLNEGHAALLTLDLLNRWRIPPAERMAGELAYDIAEVRERCVFTTHTPVEAGQDRFPYELFEQLLPGFVELDALKRLAGDDRLNMTRLALNLAGYVNGVARRHAETTEHMFPGYRVHAITNGVHVGTWAHAAFAQLYSVNFPQWQHEPEVLVRVLQLPEDDIWHCHEAAKRDLIREAKEITGVALDPHAPILGFARRMTGYKRPLLLFEDLDRLADLANRHPFQVVLAGKAHPRDGDGKEAIRRIHEIARRLKGRVTCVFLPDYDMRMARTLVAGRLDTVVLPGGGGVDDARTDSELVTWIKAVAGTARRIVTVCTGAFLAAEAGLLDGCRVTTHWAFAGRLAREFPAIDVDPDPIFVRSSDTVWTAAGVTAGIDLALSLVEDDHGTELAQTVARYLVLYLRRPGGQTQFAAPVWMPRAKRPSIREVQEAIEYEPGGSHSIGELARRATMSPRHFTRVFTDEVGEAPSHYVERIRTEAARRQLEETDDTVVAIASRCGFGTAETMRRNFIRRVGVSPDQYRKAFA